MKKLVESRATVVWCAVAPPNEYLGLAGSRTTYILVPAVTRHLAKVRKLGGSVCRPKTAVPGMGYFALYQDTEDNTFAIWERNPKAK